MSLVERFIVLCPYLGESTIRGSLYAVHKETQYRPECINITESINVAPYMKTWLLHTITCT